MQFPATVPRTEPPELRGALYNINEFFCRNRSAIASIPLNDFRQFAFLSENPADLNIYAIMHLNAHLSTNTLDAHFNT